MKKLRLLFLSILSGVLLAFSWPEIGWVPIIFIAWFPLLIVEESLLQESRKATNAAVFGYSYITFLIWNIGATWWVVNASFEGGLMAFFANSLLMSCTFTIFHAVRRGIKGINTAWLLPAFWIAFESFHHNWDLSWPWLTLGNAFAGTHQLIQWYEFTGTSGGSLWALLVNIGFFEAAKRYYAKDKAFPVKPIVRALALGLLIPGAFSLLMYAETTDKGKTAQIAIVQPNVDPYNEKFDPSTIEQQLDNFLSQAKTVVDKKTDWLLGPETALVGSMNEADIWKQSRILKLSAFADSFPRLNVLTGIESHRFYLGKENKTITARKAGGAENVYYDAYNTAILLKKDSLRLYHKSKLVPGVEQMPFPAFFQYFEDFAINMGGTTGTLGTQEERTLFIGLKQNGIAAPSVCYESIYGDFMAEYVRNGASFIAIITNDGWWGETPGYKQHLAYAKLRAIENRRSIARAANTGVSCFINQRGDIQQAQPYWQKAAIKQDVALNNELTIFSITGDLIGKSAIILSLGLIVFAIYTSLKKKKNKIQSS
jgi:apolipoprotein N-acyltransferase